MSKVAMPEPVAWMLAYQTIGGDVGWKLSWTQSGAGVCHRLSGESHEKPLITTTQAEAYADARVAESQQWISVDDRLPETNRGISGWARVLAYWTTSDPDYEPGGIETSFFDGRNWQGANGDMDYHGARRVTHWMPLPEPTTE